MRKTKIIFAQVAALILIITLSYVLTPLNPEHPLPELYDCNTYNTGWTISTANGSTTYDVLPSYYITDNESDIWISKTIEPDLMGKSIGFFSFQQQVSVYIDGSMVYEFVPVTRYKNSTPGNKWNIIRLNNTDESCEVTIHIKECYSSSRIAIPTIYYGTDSGIMITYLRHEGIALIISMLMIVFGMGLAFFLLTYKKRTGYEKNLVWLSIFAIFRGIWTLTESNVYSFFLERILIISQLSYMALKISTAAFLQFVNESFHRGQNKVISTLAILSSLDFWFSIICQYILGIDFAYTVVTTHLILLVGGLYTCASSFSIFKNTESYKDSSDVNIVNIRFKKISYGAHTISSLAIIISSLIDLVRYYFFHSPDIARFSRWGDLIYIFVISILISINFINLLKMGHNAAVIKAEASKDPMTKILNRSSFERDIVAGSKNEWENQGVAMLDLNNLKHFNDTHGHGMGDYYIIISSEIISDAFADHGTVYRIGGDEFCVITTNVNIEDFVAIRTHIEEHMASLKLSSPDLHMEVSAGFAEFDAKLDHNLRDTMKRADEFMYKRKMQLKNHRD